MNKVRIKPEIIMLSPARARVSWALDKTMVDERLTEAEHKVSSGKCFNGFRSGRAPRHVLWQHKHRDIQKAFIEAVVPQLWQELFADGPASFPFLPVDQPRFDRLDPKHGSDIVVTAEVDILPVLGLARGDYLGLAVMVPVMQEINDETIASMIEDRRHYWVTFKQAPEGQPASTGDYLLIRWRERAAGTEDWGQSLQLGMYLHDENGNRVPGFDDHLIGAKIGEKLGFILKTPDGVDVEVDILGIDDHKLRILPSTEDVARHEGVSDLKALQQKFRVALETESQARRDAEKRHQIMMKLVSPALPIPQRMVEEKYHEVEQEAQFRALKSGMRFDDSPEHKSDLQRMANRRVQEEIVLDEIVRLEAIQISDDEIEEEIKKMAAFQNESPDEIRLRLERRGSIGGLQRGLAQRKALELIIDNAVMTEEVVI